MLRVELLCIGRLKAGAERDLQARYLARACAAGRHAGLAFAVRELDESRAGTAPQRRADEAGRLRTAAGDRVVALDEGGEAITSMAFATLLGAARDEGAGSLALLLGGADGLDPALKREATRTVAFGAMTWPHQLVRIMACEQLYRAVTILSGHPYHRA